MSSGAITTSARSLAQSLDAGLSVTASTDDQSFDIAASAVFSRIWSGADAIGIDGGSAFADLIQSTGPISVTSSARSKSLSVQADIAVVNSGMSLGASFVDAAILADSAATGILARDHGDWVTAASIDAVASSGVSTLVVDAAVTVAKEQGLVGSGSFIGAEQNSTAIARGIDRFTQETLPGIGIGGLAAGTTEILVGSKIKADATADGNRVGIAANVTVASEGVALGATMLKLSNVTLADAGGFVGGLQSDILTSGGSIAANARADLLSSSTGITVAAAKNGVAAGVVLAASDTTSRAVAAGVDLGGGTDRATLNRNVSASAVSENTNNVNNVAVTAAKNGLAISAAMADLQTNSQAVATAVAAGDGTDQVAAAEGLTASASADADAIVNTIALSGTMNGVAAGASLARTQGTANATASGAAMGSGNDLLTVTGTVDVDSLADISTTGVGVTVAGSYQGVSLGVSLLDLSGDALSTATGADGGSGDDRLELRSAFDIDSNARGNSTGVSVALSGAVYGVAGAGAVVMGSSRTVSHAFGLNGGLGSDTLLSVGGTVDSIARATRTDVAVSVSASIGLSVSGNFLDTSSTAMARSAGLSGDGLPGFGGGNDTLASSGRLTVNSNAYASGASYAFAVAIAPVGIGANVVTGSVLADSRATGLDGGDGADLLTASALVETGSTATAKASSLSFGLGLGVNVGDLSTAADAGATSLAGGIGNDALQAVDTITTATAVTQTSSIGIAFTGLSIADLGTAAQARATALDGGEGDDALIATGVTRTTATASTPVSSTQVALTGGTDAQIANAGFARAVGLDGGGGSDRIGATGSIISNATSGVSTSSLGINIAGASGNKVDSSSVSQALGVSGGAGNDVIEIGSVNATGLSTATSQSTNVNLVGAGISSAGLVATSQATGVEGGDGDDTAILLNGGTTTSTASSATQSVGVSLVGVQFDASTTRASANGSLATAGAGRDRIELATAGSGLVNATATANTSSTSISLAGGAGAFGGANAVAFGEGLNGGADADTLFAGRNLTVRASATASADLVNFTLVGGSGGRSGIDAAASTLGLDGGLGTDMVVNAATLDVKSTSVAGYSSMRIQGIGGSSSSAGLNGFTGATGLTGGGGADSVGNSGTVLVLARSAGNGRTSSFSLVDVSGFQAVTTQTALSTGVDGGEGVDFVQNTGTVTGRSEALAENSSLSLSLVGATIQDSSTTLAATTIGLGGGLGTDTIDNAGRTEAFANSNGQAVSISGSFLGGTSGSLSSNANATAVGIDGGADMDAILNRGTLVANAASVGQAGTLNVTILGGASTAVTTNSQATTSGISGGTGNDQITNNGSIEFASNALLMSTARNLAVIGATTPRFGLNGSATGAGLSGGDGDDIVVNAQGASVSGSATTNLQLLSSSFGLLGGSVNNGLARAFAAVTGLAGGLGADTLNSAGAITLTANASVLSIGGSVQGLGASLAAADLTSAAEAIGLDGGDGNDALSLTGGLSVGANASAVYNASSLTLLGLSSVQGVLGASASAWGLRGGSGTNTAIIEAPGVALVTAAAATNLQSNVRAGLGAATGSGAVASISRATGVEGGNQDDDVRVLTGLTVTARSEIDLGASQLAFAGAATGQASGLARATARGVAVGAGSNIIRIAGPLTVRALGDAAGSGASGSDIGSTNAAAAVRNELFGLGVESGSGVDSFTLAGPVTVDLGSTTRTRATVNGATLFSSAQAVAAASTLFEGYAVRDTGGNTSLTISAPVLVTTRAGDNLSGVDQTRASAFSAGATLDVQANADALADANSRSFLRGVWVGVGQHMITNSSTIQVNNAATARADSRADGTSVFEGHATARANGGIFGGATVGIDAPATLTLNNTGVLSVAARPITSAVADAGANGSGFVDPDANATVAMFGHGVTAVGVLAADGTVTNNGQLFVTSAPTVSGLAIATRRGDGARNTDGFASADVAADNTVAWGVRLTGSTSSTVTNNGEMTVQALPSVIAEARAFGTGRDGDAVASAFARANLTRAVAIETGAGGDTVVNSGRIFVRAAPSAVVRTTVSPAGSGVGLPTQIATASGTSWTGIATGAGNDRVTNSGDIDARGGTAIDTGAGDDVVRVFTLPNEAAEVYGAINLGDGSDTFEIEGKVVLDNVVNGGTGVQTDLLIASGEQNFVLGATNFESMIKRGDGVVNLGPVAWNPSVSTTVERGRLQVVGGLTNSAHTLTTTIYADGAVGAVDMTVGRAQPRGRIVVAAGASATPFVSGRSWDVLRAPGGLDLSLARTPELPATALVKFGSAIVGGTTLRVTSAVTQMSPMAQTSEGRSIGSAFDRATASAGGEVANAIAGLQRLASSQEVGASLDRMAPRLSRSPLGQAGLALDGTMALISMRQAGLGFAPMQVTPGLRFIGSEPGTGQLGSWAVSFDRNPVATGAAGAIGRASGFASGWDYAPRDNWRIGVAVARQIGEQRGDGQSGLGQTTTLAMHTLFAPEPSLRLTAALALGGSQFEGSRSVIGGHLPDVARLTGSTALFAFDSGVEWDLPLASAWRPTLVGLVNYRRAEYDGYREGTGSGLALVSDFGRRERLEGGVGLRLAPETRIGDWTLSGRLDGTMVHRFAGGDILRARFADMPDFSFDIVGDWGARTRIDWGAGFALTGRNGLSLAAEYRSRFAGPIQSDELRASVRLPF